jgi:SAM-dependent methyltransferase
MSREEQERRDRRYAAGEYRPRTRPSPFLVKAVERIPPGRAIDLACGTGRNALFLAERGFEVEGVDISELAIRRAAEEARRRGLEVLFRVADLDEEPLREGRYRLITLFRYVNRDLWPRVVRALAPDGWLVTEQHLQTSRAVVGPPDPYRVAPGELLEAFGVLRVVEYWEGVEPADRPGGEAVLARLAACKGDPGF